MPEVARLASFGPLPWVVLGAVMGIAAFGAHGIGAILLLLFGGAFLLKRMYRWQAAANGQPVTWPSCGGSWGRRWERRDSMRRSGNSAFDDYRQEMIQRLEQDHMEFQSFLERLRRAKDKAEFDQFMAERDRRGPVAPQAGPTQEPPASPWPHS
jgi:hypothetical protein